MSPDCKVYDLENGFYLCVGGRWDGWMLRKHADGQFITHRRAREVKVEVRGDTIPLLYEEDAL